MKQFADMAREVDSSNKTNDKVSALERFFRTAPDDDKLWAIALLTGRRPRRVISPALMREWASRLAAIPLWLFEDSYHVVGDLGETISLLVPTSGESTQESLTEWMEKITRFAEMDDASRRISVESAWSTLSPFEIFIFNKLISGSFRLGVSAQLVFKALAAAEEKPVPEIAHRLTGNWSPWDTTYSELLKGEHRNDAQPYPFFLAYQLEGPPENLGDPERWQAEWKWDGIRGQIVKRNGSIHIWSRGEELITEKFPELMALVNVIPDGTVLDGEIIPWKEGQVLPFAKMQTRIGRKNLTQKILQEVPIAFFAYDLLEWSNEDLREKPFSERRVLLENVVRKIALPHLLVVHEPLQFESWNQLAELRTISREILSEGIMLKDLSSSYGTGRRKGSWWKWKVDPLSVDAVLIYAVKGSGRRADLYTDYTFAVRDDQGGLVPFAKAYSGLTDEEIRRVNAFIRKNTVEKFGPVRSVKPELVFEIGFEGINKSSRHRSGFAVRFPRILRWRTDKPVEEADSLETLRQLIEIYG